MTWTTEQKRAIPWYRAACYRVISSLSSSWRHKIFMLDVVVSRPKSTHRADRDPGKYVSKETDYSTVNPFFYEWLHDS
jgi:hypothetical protein